MKISVVVTCAILVLTGINFIPNAFTQESAIPYWIKNNADWWATDQIDDSSFLQGIQYLIKEGIMVIPPTEASGSSGSDGVPAWVKNTAGGWADGLIDDNSFVTGIQYLISNSIIKISEECKFDSEEYSHLFDGEREVLCDKFNLNFVTEPIPFSTKITTYNNEGFLQVVEYLFS